MLAVTTPGRDPVLRSVQLVAESTTFKALYLDRDRMALRPNLVFVDMAGNVIFETNELGLKGDPLDPSRKLAVVWGDSVAFGSGVGWPCLLDDLAPGWQFLNGGLDGDPYTNILRRASAFNRQHAVALNLLMLGWHPFLPERIVRQRPSRWARLLGGGTLDVRLARGGNANLRRDLVVFLQQVPNTVVLTMPTALNRRIIEQDLSAYFIDGDDDTLFRFIGYVPYQVAGQRQGFEHIVERNAITREVCAELGVRLIDLYAAFDTEGAADFREHFFDILHLRPRSYPLAARLVYDGLKDLLA
jgi:lysophospholipase L1-like esterase